MGGLKSCRRRCRGDLTELLIVGMTELDSFYRRDIERMIGLFLPDAQVVCETGPQIAGGLFLQFDLVFEEHQVTATVTASGPDAVQSDLSAAGGAAATSGETATVTAAETAAETAAVTRSAPVNANASVPVAAASSSTAPASADTAVGTAQGAQGATAAVTALAGSAGSGTEDPAAKAAEPNRSGEDRVAANAAEEGSGKCLVRRRRRLPVSPEADAATRRKVAKRAILFALHETLSEWTGAVQPWGILTGVRPTKLAHALVRRGLQDGRPVSDAKIAATLQSDYLIDPARARLVTEIIRREREVVPDLYRLDRAVSVYVGIPFCPTHCAYCTFPAYSMVDKAQYAEGFLAALIREIRMAGEVLREYGVPVTSVYVGGGTPTSLKAPELAELLQNLLLHIPARANWREFCVEAGRADTITADRVQVMKDFGIDRVSVNPQSFKAATLKHIGRGHSPDIVDKRFALFREAGFDDINMDLILGLPGENLADVLYSLERTLALRPDEVTVHTLSFKRAAVVTREREAFPVPDDDTVRRMMTAADSALRGAGLRPYYLYRQKDILANLENVGYALPGKEGVYNICIIEEAQTVVALGGGAASKWVTPGSGVITRHQNPSEPLAYVSHIDRLLQVKEAKLRSVCEAINSSG